MRKFKHSISISLAMLLGSILTIGLSANVSPTQSLQTAELDINFTANYSLVWTDQGSGAAANVSFWRPEPPAGWFRLGHHMKRGYGNPTQPTIIVRERVSGTLVRPVDYFPVWDDAGSGAALDSSVWRPACPSGFRAMGDVTNRSHMKPALDEVVCVQQNSLGAAISGGEIWNDTGSGAARDFAAWNVDPPIADASFDYASRGLFFGNASHSRPQANSIGGLWAIRIPRASIGNTISPASGASVDQQFWDTIKSSQRASDYQSYLQNFPNGQFAALARLRIDQLNQVSSPVQSPGSPSNTSVDQQFWDSIKSSQRASDYQSYLRNFPNGQFAALARLKIDQLNQTTLVVQNPSTPLGQNVDQQFWDSIKNSQRVSDYQSYLQNFPNGQFAALARLKIDQLNQFTPGPTSPNPSGQSVDEQFWDSIKNSQRVTDYQTYLQNFPSGQFAALARLKIDQLNQFTPPVSQQPTSQRARFLNQMAADNRAKLPITVGDVQLFDALSLCRTGCQQADVNDIILIRGKTPRLAKQNVSIAQIDRSLRPAMVKGYCGSPEQTNNVTMGIDIVDMFNQSVGNFFIGAADCGSTAGSQPPTVASRPPSTGFQQVIASAQPGSFNEIARARSFFVVSNDFSIKSKIAAVLTKELPQLQAAISEQTADFLIGFELTDKTTGRVTANDSANPNLRGELIVFRLIPAIGNNPETIRILRRITKERGFGVFSATPDENAAKDLAKDLAKILN